MGDYFNYYPLKLKGFEKFFFKAIVFSARVILIAIGFAFMFSGVSVFKALGFWLFIIFAFCFVRTKFWSSSDIRIGKSRNLADYFNQDALDLVFDTFKDLENTNIHPPLIVLLFKLTYNIGARDILKKLNVDLKNFQNEIASRVISKDETIEIDLIKNKEYLIKENFLPIFIRAREIAKSLSLPSISTEIIFAAMCECENFEMKDIFDKFRITPEFMRSATTNVIFYSRKKPFLLIQPLAKFIKLYYSTGFDIKKISMYSTPFLHKYGLNLTILARTGKLGFLIGHRREIGEMISIFSRVSKPNILIYGDDNIGKKSIVWHFAWLMANGFHFGKFSNYKIIQIDIAELFSKNEKEFKQIFSRILSEASISGETILFFPDIQKTIFFAGDSVITTITPFLSSGLPIIMSANFQSISTIKQFDEFQNYFKDINVDELSIIEAISVLTLEAKFLEQKYKTSITPQAVAALVELVKRYFSEKPIIDSAKKIMNEIFIFTQTLKSGNYLKLKTITEEIVGDFIAKKSIN